MLFGFLITSTLFDACEERHMVKPFRNSEDSLECISELTGNYTAPGSDKRVFSYRKKLQLLGLKG